MKELTDHMKIPDNEHLLHDLSSFIEERHRELLRVTNASLITLFWELGAAYNQYLGKNKAHGLNQSLIHALSNRLVASYGPYFTEENLKELGRFAGGMSFLTAVQIAPFVSWEHMQLILQLEQEESWLFYIILSVKQGLSVPALSKEISSNAFERAKGHEKFDVSYIGHKKRPYQPSTKANKFLQPELLRQQKAGSFIIGDFFKAPLVSAFRPLIDPTVAPSAEYLENTSAGGTKIFELFAQHIEKFRNDHNKWLNARLNLCFIEIGKRINGATRSNNHENKGAASLIKDAALALQKQYGKCFSERELDQMATFAEQASDFGAASRIAQLVTWDHILVLLPLKEIEETLFYARLTATHGWSVIDLREQIRKNVYQHTNGAKEREQNTIAVMKDPVKKTSVKKGSGKILEIEEVLINYGDDIHNSMAVINIFKNPYFSSFITAF
jgi:predicted nuclease of restriction endonuclease-like (RecB) superfamily